MPFGSWTDAQNECEKNGTHLWTINSHEEWYNVYTKRWIHVPARVTGQARPFSGAIFDPLIAQHFFIGLVLSTSWSVKKVQSYIHNYMSNVNDPLPYTIRGVALKAPPPPSDFFPHAFNFGAASLCVGDFSEKIV